MNADPYKKIKLLYYSNALVANHGGRKHSEAFLSEAGKSPWVESVIAYPTPIQEKRGTLKKVEKWKTFIKKLPFFQVFSFYSMNYRSYKEILKVIRKNDINVIHIRVTGNFMLIDKLRKEFPDLIITTEVNASPFDEVYQDIIFKRHFERMEQACLEEADANFFVSDFLRKRIMGQFRDGRDFVVPNGVDLELFPPRPAEYPRDVFTFGYVGTIDYHKDLEVLIDAFEHIERARPGKARLVIIGDGPMMGTLRTYLRKKKVQDRMELLGWVAHSDIYHFLEKMHVAIHHSAKEYMSPLKVFEYMAVGLPVIGPDIPAIREILVDGEDILLVAPTVEAISEKMLLLMENEEKRKTLAAHGQKKVRADFGWKNNADHILSAIGKKLEEKKL